MPQHNNSHPPPTAKTSIILPTYKERDNIVELVQAIHRHLEPDGFNYEVVIVDDDSPDGTADVVRAAFGSDPRVKLHVRTQERGLATALRYGAEHSEGEVLADVLGDGVRNQSVGHARRACNQCCYTAGAAGVELLGIVLPDHPGSSHVRRQLVGDRLAQRRIHDICDHGAAHCLERFVEGRQRDVGGEHGYGHAAAYR
ncbi:MAG: glycosyltransferase [Anaerolineae bacterium]